MYNTAFSVNKDGELINEYDKVHLVPMLREPEFLTDGNKVPEPFQLSDGTLATQIICYDLRFPELLRYPAKMVLKLHFTLHNGLVLDLIIGWHCLKQELLKMICM